MHLEAAALTRAVGAATARPASASASRLPSRTSPKSRRPSRLSIALSIAGTAPRLRPRWQPHSNTFALRRTYTHDFYDFSPGFRQQHSLAPRQLQSPCKSQKRHPPRTLTQPRPPQPPSRPRNTHTRATAIRFSPSRTRAPATGTHRTTRCAGKPSSSSSPRPTMSCL